MPLLYFLFSYKSTVFFDEVNVLVLVIFVLSAIHEHSATRLHDTYGIIGIHHLIYSFD